MKKINLFFITAVLFFVFVPSVQCAASESGHEIESFFEASTCASWSALDGIIYTDLDRTIIHSIRMGYVSGVVDAAWSMCAYIGGPSDRCLFPFTIGFYLDEIERACANPDFADYGIAAVIIGSNESARDGQ